VESFKEAGWTLRNGRLQDAAATNWYSKCLLVNPSLEADHSALPDQIGAAGHRHAPMRTVDRASVQVRSKFDYE